jgi:hypothetical protein
MTRSDRFALIRTAAAEWIISDGRYAAADPRSVVAHVWEVDTNECEVTWSREVALPTSYASPDDVLADLRAGRRSRKPVPIPHFAPVGTSSRESPVD